MSCWNIDVGSPFSLLKILFFKTCFSVQNFISKGFSKKKKMFLMSYNCFFIILMSVLFEQYIIYNIFDTAYSFNRYRPSFLRKIIFWFYKCIIEMYILNIKRLQKFFLLASFIFNLVFTQHINDIDDHAICILPKFINKGWNEHSLRKGM